MPQDPLLVDQIQLEPGSGDTLLIRRAADGSIEFVDAVVTGGITLQQLAGLQSVCGMKTVGKSGAGAQYTTIQAALDAVPAMAGPLEPYVILIGPGVYQETVNIVRDWVTLVGLGGVVIESAETTPNGPGAYHTVVVQADLGTIPKYTLLRDITVHNHHNNFACVRIVGAAASEVGDTGTWINNCDLQAVASGGNRQVWATSMNTLEVRGGSFTSSTAISSVLVQECARFVMDGVADVMAVQVDYDTGGTLPNTPGSYCRLHGCGDLGFTSTLNPPVSSTLVGAGSLVLSNCGRTGDVRFGGNRSFTVVGTNTGDLDLQDAVTVELVGSKRGTLTAAGGVTLEEPVQQGSVSFAAASSEAVALPATAPDTNYQVSLELDQAPAAQEVPWIAGKTTAGFTINFTGNQTLVASWTVRRAP